MRHVRGVLFVDYVRMLRRQLGKDFAQQLIAEDQLVLNQRVETDHWYPMATFERLGLLILSKVVGPETDAIRLWGRSQVDAILQWLPDLTEAGNARDSVMRFQVFLSSLFDFDAVSIVGVDDESATITVGYGMGAQAEEAAAWQTVGFFESLVTACGGAGVVSRLVSSGWVEGRATTFELHWQGRVPTPHDVPLRPRVLVVDDEHLVAAALDRILTSVSEVVTVKSADEAIAALQTGSFDTVLSDFNMPGRDGLSLLAEVRQRWPLVRCVLHSSDVPEHAQALKDAGALDEVLHKPAPLDVLRRAIMRR